MFFEQKMSLSWLKCCCHPRTWMIWDIAFEQQQKQYKSKSKYPCITSSLYNPEKYLKSFFWPLNGHVILTRYLQIDIISDRTWKLFDIQLHPFSPIYVHINTCLCYNCMMFVILYTLPWVRDPPLLLWASFILYFPLLVTMFLLGRCS